MNFLPVVTYNIFIICSLFFHSETFLNQDIRLLKLALCKILSRTLVWWLWLSWHQHKWSKGENKRSSYSRQPGCRSTVLLTSVLNKFFQLIPTLNVKLVSVQMYWHYSLVLFCYTLRRYIRIISGVKMCCWVRMVCSQNICTIFVHSVKLLNYNSIL